LRKTRGASRPTLRVRMVPMKLSPSQERAVEALRHDWPDTDAFVLWAPYGLGRSTMLQAVQKERGGIVLDMASYLERLTETEPLALEETLHQMLMGALRENDVVLVGDSGDDD
jgi:hypothetical protein